MRSSEYLTISQTARQLGLSADRIRQLVRTGRLGSVMTPLGRLIPAEEVERLARERAEQRSRQARAGVSE